MEELTRACRGVHNFLATPFLPDGALDVEGLRGNVAYHAERHPRDMTIVVTCNLGELFSLDLEERIAPMAAVRSLRPGYSAAGIKVALETVGRAGGPTRPPMGRVSAEDRPRIEAIVRRHAET